MEKIRKCKIKLSERRKPVACGRPSKSSVGQGGPGTSLVIRVVEELKRIRRV